MTTIAEANTVVVMVSRLPQVRNTVHQDPLRTYSSVILHRCHYGNCVASLTAYVYNSFPPLFIDCDAPLVPYQALARHP